jgi:enamine deaminase RidA (YjgF/YER057c/UK114 family)
LDAANEADPRLGLLIDANGFLVGDDAETQTRQVFENLRTALAAAGFDRVAKITVHLLLSTIFARS